MDNRTFTGFSDVGAFENQYEAANPYQKIKKTTEWEHALNLGESQLKGAAAGAGSGAAIGSAFGTVALPGIGTVGGGAAGALIGGAIGAIGGTISGVKNIFDTDKKEADLSKQAEKINAAIDEQKYAQMRTRQISNDIKASQAQSAIATNNMTDYLSSIENPY